MRILAIILGAITMPISAGATEEPPHAVVIDDGKFQLREYEPAIVAEVDVSGDMRDASRSGFRPLADFIFGNNTSQSKIDMTAPVTRRPSEEIAMTAPVTRAQTGPDAWTVTFYMPDEYTMETLPTPNNERVIVREEPARLIAAVRFSGNGPESSFRKKQTELEVWIDERGYRAVGQARYAGYDAPYVPGPFRRNEVMIEVEAAN